jgi:iron complex outermembrane receptor protein
MLSSAAFALATQANAQAQPAAEAAAQSADRPGIADIIVTAQRRSERLQDVPISISAVDSSRLAAQGVSDAEGLNLAVPSLTFNRNANNANIYIRGVGTDLYGPNTEQTVAVYVDGVYYASPEAAILSFNNIERVEVLKGPQGTLFGRNTTGGVVQVITRDPSPEPSADVEVGYANYDTVKASFYATGGTDTLAADIAATYANQGTAYGRNLVTGSGTGIQADDNYAIRSKILWRPGDSTRIVLAGDYSRSFNNDAHQITPGHFGVDGVTTYPGRFNSTGGVDDFQRTEVGGASLTLDRDLGSVKLVSISAYRELSSQYVIDQDSTPAPISDVDIPSKSHQFSQELQLQGDSSEGLTWLLGGYYYNAKAGFTPLDVTTPIGHVVIDDYQKTRSFAGFAQATIGILTDTNLTAGLRYTTEKQRLVIDEFNVFGTIIPVPGAKQEASKLTWRVSLDHRFAPDILGYVSFNRGFKSGGFNLAAPFDAGYKPEVLDAYEAGLKTQLLDRRLRFNVAAFYYDYTNIQTAIPFAGQTAVVNGPKARLYGLDADFEARVTDSFTLSGGVTFLGSKYLKFPEAPFISATGVLASGNAAGNKLPSASPVVASLTATYTIESKIGRIVPTAALLYNHGYEYYPDNRLKQSSFFLLNPSIAWTSESERYGMRLWAKNVLDERYFLHRSEQVGLGDVQREANPRTYGVSLSAHF